MTYIWNIHMYNVRCSKWCPAVNWGLRSAKITMNIYLRCIHAAMYILTWCPQSNLGAEAREIGNCEFAGSKGGGIGTASLKPGWSRLPAVEYIRCLYAAIVQGDAPTKKQLGVEAREMNNENWPGPREEAGVLGDRNNRGGHICDCLLYTSDAADE